MLTRILQLQPFITVQEDLAVEGYANARYSASPSPPLPLLCYASHHTCHLPPPL